MLLLLTPPEGSGGPNPWISVSVFPRRMPKTGQSRSSLVTQQLKDPTLALITAVAWVRDLAWELLYDPGAAKKRGGQGTVSGAVC